MNPVVDEYGLRKASDFAVLEGLYVDGWRILAYIGPERKNFYFGSRPQDDVKYDKIRVRYLDGTIEVIEESELVRPDIGVTVKASMSGGVDINKSYFESRFGFVPRVGVTFRVKVVDNKKGTEYYGRGTITSVKGALVHLDCPQLEQAS